MSTTLVLDSSAGIRLAMSAAARRSVADVAFVVPSLFWSETTSAVHEAVWRGEVDDTAAAALRQQLHGLVQTTVPSSELADRAWAIADELGWAKTYDAEFLALAGLRGTRVLTTDARLRRGADRTGLVVDPTEL